MRLGDLDALKEALTNTETSLKYMGVFTVDDVREFIDNAPTVDVKGDKIIRCIDCKYYHPFKHWCDCHEDWAGGEDGFCSLAEMKGGDNE